MMNSNSQFDVHPDAESLNAFLERALPEQERGQIVAHLAECGRCREVVFLAQVATGEMNPELELVAAAASGPPSPSDFDEKKEPWYRNWRLVWVPAGALAVIVTAAVVVHVHHEEIAAEQARAAREAAGRRVEMASTPAAPQMEMQAAPAASARKSLKAEAPSLVRKPLTPVAAPPAVGEQSAMVSVSSHEPALPPETAGTGYPAMDATAVYKAAPALAARQQEQERAVGAFQAREIAAERRPDAKAVASANAPAVHGQATGGPAAAAPTAELEMSSSRSGSAMESGGHKEGGLFAVYKSRPSVLPSGLTAVSTAVTSSVTVALDGAGGVFLSKDAGSHWESVAKQWSGRAAAVRLQTTGVEDAGAVSGTRAFFEIVNDKGQVWTSTDGRNWKAK